MQTLLGLQVHNFFEIILEMLEKIKKAKEMNICKCKNKQ